MVVDLTSVPLRALTNESRNILSSLLNPKKVIPIDGPDQLPKQRDWRGLASLAQISTEAAASINDHHDKTAKVLEIWSKSAGVSATVAKLLDYLQIIDRYDACEDLMDLQKQNKLITLSNCEDTQIITWDGDDRDFLTYDDKLLGFPQRYHAYVLYAKEDWDFVIEIVNRMKAHGLKICTEDDLLAGHPTRVTPVSRLILERCRYLVLVYSPDFLKSSDISFYANVAQSDSIKKKQIKLIPIMYRECILPELWAQYHRLYYMSRGAVNPYFWSRLVDSLQVAGLASNTNYSQSTKEIRTSSSLFIKELPSNGKVNGINDWKLALPPISTNTSSLNDLRLIDKDLALFAETKSLSNTSDTSEKKKKTIGSRILNTLKGKKSKKIAVDN